jgi:hypothetical protein
MVAPKMMSMNRSRIWLGAAAISIGTLTLIAGAGPAQSFDKCLVKRPVNGPAKTAPPAIL